MRMVVDGMKEYVSSAYVVGNHWKCPGYAIPVSTHSICFCIENYGKLSLHYHQILTLSVTL